MCLWRLPPAVVPSALHLAFAVQNTDWEACMSLIEAKASLELPWSVTSPAITTYSPRTYVPVAPIVTLLLKGQLDQVASFLQRQPSAANFTNFLGCEGCSLLHICVLIGDMDAYDMLLHDFNIDVSVKSAIGCLALPGSAHDHDEHVNEKLTAEALLLRKYQIDWSLLQQDVEERHSTQTHSDDDNKIDPELHSNSYIHSLLFPKKYYDPNSFISTEKETDVDDGLSNKDFTPYPFDVEETSIRNMFQAQQPKLGNFNALTRGQYFQMLRDLAPFADVEAELFEFAQELWCAWNEGGDDSDLGESPVAKAKSVEDAMRQGLRGMTQDDVFVLIRRFHHLNWARTRCIEIINECRQKATLLRTNVKKAMESIQNAEKAEGNMMNALKGNPSLFRSLSHAVTQARDYISHILAINGKTAVSHSMRVFK